MNNVKKYVVDYITKNFDSNSYIDNYSNHIKFLAIMDTVRKIIEEIAKQQNVK